MARYSEEKNELLALRNKDIYKRFLYYTEKKHFRYDYTIELLKKDFYICSNTIICVIREQAKQEVPNKGLRPILNPDTKTKK